MIQTNKKLSSVELLQYFLGSNEELETLILCGGQMIETTDRQLYEAMGSLKVYDDMSKRKLVKLLETVKITAAPKIILTHEKVDELRKKALGGK